MTCPNIHKNILCIEEKNKVLDRLQIWAERESQFNPKDRPPNLSATSPLWVLQMLGADHSTL
jgi:hypothetical protein